MNLFKNIISLFTIFILSALTNLDAQSIPTEDWSKASSGLKLRGIGPALMGGRIADIAVNPKNRSNWYIAAGSGNLWKTINSGITWEPVFDDQVSYSIGCVTIDPSNTSTVWLGTGENVSGRHVGWGDGIYKSTDGGKSWKQMGLSESEHIGKILVHPDNSNVVYVAAEGPLWSARGDRGLYKTVDGGQNWELVLEIDENTGVTDIEFAPGNPNIIYAAAYQRRRHIWSLLAGGPKSGIYKSTDGGSSFEKITKGIPAGDKGKIGLAVTPANPDIVYATIEASDSEKGFYRSIDKGESWEKRNSYTSGGTGPHYYQEIEVSNQDPDLIYQMDVFIHVSRDGGKTFDYLGTGREKHSDNHAMWIDPDNGHHLLAGTDAGLYETFDEGTKWRHFPNMPISQFYKLGLDNASPFYNIVGGAQDLGTLIGPSRTMNVEGIRNRDWYVPLGADGYDSAFDPTDPNTVYMEIQGGLLHRYNRKSEEAINIQPQPAPGDDPERWNWDSPILVSPHDNKTLYFGSQRLWKSKDKGNSWTPVSKDLTTNTNRYELELMDRVWSVDDLYDNGAMSKYATLTSISESPIKEGLLYTGSDDGLIQVSEDGGQNWRTSGMLPAVPERSFINDVEASRHNENTVFAVADAHKLGNYTPYVFISNDKGKSWKSISGDLGKGTIVWMIKQDHKDENLLFIGAENGVYFSPNKGINWIKLSSGVPTIAFRDIELHERDDDLVGATFGRGFYILDDYSPLRSLTNAVSEGKNTLFPVRDAWWYVPYAPMQAKGMPTLGSTSFVSDNPPFGAIITYYLADLPKTAEESRKELEKKLREDNKDIPFPGWEALKEERLEDKPTTLLLISDENGNPVRWLKGSSSKGMHRINWDLKLPASDPISLSKPAFQPPWAGDSEGPLAAPGNYKVELFVLNNGQLESQGMAQSFTVKPVPTTEEGADLEAIAAFQAKTNELSRQISNANRKMSEAAERIRFMKAALSETPKAGPELFQGLAKLDRDLSLLRMELNGDRTRGSLNEASSPSISSRVGQVAYGHWSTRQMPTETYKQNLQIAEDGFNAFRGKLLEYMNQLMAFEKAMEAAGAPWTRGRAF